MSTRHRLIIENSKNSASTLIFLKVNNMNDKLEKQVVETEATTISLQEIEQRENSVTPNNQTIWCCIVNGRF